MSPKAALGSETDEQLLRLLGDPLRARIVELLAEEMLCTSHLVELTGASQTNISNHIKALRDAGLIAGEPCGRYSYHVLQPERLSALSDRLAALASKAQGLSERRRPCG